MFYDFSSVVDAKNHQNDFHWEIKVGDILTYEAIEIVNGSTHTLIDDIYRHYYLDQVERDSFGQRLVVVKITDLTDPTNWTRIAEMVDSFTGPVNVSTQVNDTFIQVEKVFIPFALPTDGWSELNQSWNQLLTSYQNSYVHYEKTWYGEESFVLHKEYSNTIIDMDISWEEGNQKGVLQGFLLQITKNGEKDQIRFALSANINESPQDDLMDFFFPIIYILIIIVISTPFVGYFYFEKRKSSNGKRTTDDNTFSFPGMTQVNNSKKDKQPNIQYRSQPLINIDYDKISKKISIYKLMWLTINIIAALSSVILFFEPFYFLMETYGFLILAISIIAMILLTVILTYFKYKSGITLVTRRSSITEFTPLGSYIAGFVDFLVISYLLDLSINKLQYIGTLSILLLMLIIILIEIVLYFFINPWKEFSDFKKMKKKQTEM